MSEPGWITAALSRLLETWDRDNGPVDIGLIVTRAGDQYDKLRKRITELEAALRKLAFECKHSRAYERSDDLADALDEAWMLLKAAKQ